MSELKPDTSLTKPLFVWLIPQLLSLLFSVARIPLSAHPPQPIESLALTQLAIVQLFTAALFAPTLFRSIGSTLAIVLTAAPLLQLAGFLSSAPLEVTNAQWMLVSTWSIAIGVICLPVSRKNRFAITAMATTWSLGGAMLAYLHADFAPARVVSPILFGPAYFALHLTDKSPQSWWYVGHIPLLGLIIAYAIHAKRNSNHSKRGEVVESGNPPARADR